MCPAMRLTLQLACRGVSINSRMLHQNMMPDVRGPAPASSTGVKVSYNRGRPRLQAPLVGLTRGCF